MAEDFYTMQEVMEKLRKSEEQVQDLVKQGKLRQYMDAGSAMFKTDDVNELADEIVGLDVSSLGIDLAGSELELDLTETSEIQDLGGSELDLAETSAGIDEMGDDDLDLAGISEDIQDVGDSVLELAETSEIELEPDEDQSAPAASQPDSDEIEIKDKTSEGGFGLSQMGDLTMADTNVGTVGINILSGTEDAFKLTEDTKAETLSVDAEEMEELDSLDADSNMESFGSGSGLLDLSLQADDTSLGAVLDDILPAGVDEIGGGDLPIDQIGADESEDLLAEPAMAAEPMAEGTPMAAASATPGGMAAQMVAVAPVDPRTNLFGIAMFLPLAAIILVGIILTAALKGVTPSLLKMLTETEIAGVGLFWYILGGMAVFAILFSLFASVGGGGGEAKTRTKKEKKPKAKKEKKPKAKKEKKAKKK